MSPQRSATGYVDRAGKSAGIDARRPLLEATSLSKSFGATVALRDVHLVVYPGERVAVVGENGAGKSTLMKILAGVIAPDDGHLSLSGVEYRPVSPGDAIAAGVSIVHQEPTFFAQLSVLENIFMGRELKTRWGQLRWAAMRAAGRGLFEKLRLPVGLLERKMDSLSLGEQQLALIARALHQDAQLLILDEPTSILTDPEVELLFTLVEEHIAGGGGLLYISHRMNEFDRVADRIVVLKDGRVVATLRADQADERHLIQLMSGREALAYTREPHPATRSPQPVLSVRGLRLTGVYEDVDLDVHGGEIVGLYGLMGSGRTEVALSVFGHLRPDAGQIVLNGRPTKLSSPAQAIRHGIAYVPEDRKLLGLYPWMTVGANLSTVMVPKLTRRGLINRRSERRTVLEGYESLSIKSSSPDESIQNLSGGNQQKVLLARWLASHPRLLMLDEPTRGIDVGTKTGLHHHIRHAADEGMAILLISSELLELLALSDRVYVLRKGRIVTELPGGLNSEQAVLRATMGLASE